MAGERILVVDNDSQICRMMRVTLVALNFEVHEARSGSEALQRTHDEKYDLVLLDINMPGIDGIETCRRIRAASDVPIIMLTVRTALEDKKDAFDAGADDYVTKPFNMPDLLARVSESIRKKGVRLGALPRRPLPLYTREAGKS